MKYTVDTRNTNIFFSNNKHDWQKGRNYNKIQRTCSQFISNCKMPQNKWNWTIYWWLLNQNLETARELSQFPHFSVKKLFKIQNYGVLQFL